MIKYSLVYLHFTTAVGLSKIKKMALMYNAITRAVWFSQTSDSRMIKFTLHVQFVSGTFDTRYDCNIYTTDPLWCKRCKQNVKCVLKPQKWFTFSGIDMLSKQLREVPFQPKPEGAAKNRFSNPIIT